MCVDNEDNLRCAVLHEERLCDGEVCGDFVVFVVDVCGMRPLGAWGGVEGALNEHQLRGHEMVFCNTGLRQSHLPSLRFLHS